MSALPFLTAYDPLGGTSGSIDPLGALRSYGALVDLLLPGMSTITTRSRYLSMICGALSNAAKYNSFPPGPAGLARRRHAVEPFERLWALACATARQKGRRGAADNLRGVSFAEQYLRELQKQRQPANPDFEMLKSQSRTAGVATYWTSLRGGELVLEDGVLTREGEQLAKEFPLPPISERELERLCDPASCRRVSMPLEALETWGNACHLGAARAEEQHLLANALRCDDRRDAIATALLAYEAERPLPDEWDIPALRQLRSHVEADDLVCNLALPVVIDAIIALEQFHEAARAVFRALLWWGTENGDRPVGQLLLDKDFRDSTTSVRERAANLVTFASSCEEASVRRAIQEFVIFAADMSRARDAHVVLDEMLRRHHRVQSGKVDGSVPKGEWVALAPTSEGKLLRPAPRYQETERPATAHGRVLTHPYRIEQFVGMLRETGALAGRATEGRNDAG